MSKFPFASTGFFSVGCQLNVAATEHTAEQHDLLAGTGPSDGGKDRKAGSGVTALLKIRVIQILRMGGSDADVDAGADVDASAGDWGVPSEVSGNSMLDAGATVLVRAAWAGQKVKVEGVVVRLDQLDSSNQQHSEHKQLQQQLQQQQEQQKQQYQQQQKIAQEGVAIPNIRSLLEDFYNKHDKSKVGQIDKILVRTVGYCSNPPRV